MGTTSSNESRRPIPPHQDLSKDNGRWKETSDQEHHPKGPENGRKGKTSQPFIRGFSTTLRDNKKEYELRRERRCDGDLHHVLNRGRNTFDGGTNINELELPDSLSISEDDEMFSQREDAFTEIRWRKAYIHDPSRSTSRSTSTSSLNDCCSQCSCYEEQEKGDPSSTSSNQRVGRELGNRQATPRKQYSNGSLLRSHSRESIGGKQTNEISKQLIRSPETRPISPISRNSKTDHKTKEKFYNNEHDQYNASSSISAESCAKPTLCHTFPALKTKSCYPAQDITRVGHTEGRSKEAMKTHQNHPKNNTSFGENWDVMEEGLERPHRPYPTSPHHELSTQFARRQTYADVEDRNECYRPKDRREGSGNREVSGEHGEKIDLRPNVRENRRRGNRRLSRIEVPFGERSSSVSEHVTYANGITLKGCIRWEGSSDSCEDVDSVTRRSNTKWKRKSRDHPASREPQSPPITRYPKDYLRQPPSSQDTRKTDARKKDTKSRSINRSRDYLDRSESIDYRSLKKEHIPVVCLPSSPGRGGHFMQDQTFQESQHRRSVSRRSSLRQEECTVPYVVSYDELLSGPFKIFLDCSNQIGGDVASIAKLVQETFINQRAFLVMASKSQRPLDMELPQVLEPTGKKIQEVIAFRESKRQSPFFNHLSAVSESIPGLSWVAVAPAPGPYVKEMGDSAIFYTNRVLKEYRSVAESSKEENMLKSIQ